MDKVEEAMGAPLQTHTNDTIMDALLLVWAWRQQWESCMLSVEP